ncbi:Bug family tripartite tricarboxylate transporter substrate binding protein [Dietzia psychralcaliphila]|uniref:Tricarboxylic transporter n=1 Tax=Dietzia psychralcaliphila TaxID=139021 RepID=A0AAD0JTD4_9ACTN|nr:tripartite tricarboxylate transporter substrate-binding protein [Dietzia psychralcaliphila]AWH96242.1 tricarboxylic transporter [Dietzia psychralcaliphila]PTM90683.1 putative tricarboxylic transport membrane protein [Dietzia psychralcaliphila]
MRQHLARIVTVVLAVGLTTVAVTDASSSGGGDNARTQLNIIAPAAPGGGWDTFGREAQQALMSNGIVNAVRVRNVPGAAGTIGLTQFVQLAGRTDSLLVTGGVMVGGVILQDSDATLEDTTPIARLADDYNVLVVPANSPYQTLDEFMAAWRERPGMAIAGGSLGSIDHLLTGMLADAAGIDPSLTNYIAYAGGGEVVRAMISGSAVGAISSANDFAAQIEVGELRALGISSATPLEEIPTQTFIEQGVDVSMSNWRGLVAPPDIPDEVRDELIAILTEMRDTEEWRDTLDRNDWTDSFMAGEQFERFLDAEVASTEEIIKELGQ